jgi:hypothetical protein
MADLCGGGPLRTSVQRLLVVSGARTAHPQLSCSSLNLSAVPPRPRSPGPPDRAAVPARGASPPLASFSAASDRQVGAGALVGNRNADELDPFIERHIAPDFLADHVGYVLCRRSVQRLGHVPYPDRLIVAAGDQVFAIRTICQRPHLAVMSGQGMLLPSLPGRERAG